MSPSPPRSLSRKEARRLRGDAEAGWQAIKQWFEGQLLTGDIPQNRSE